MRPDHNTKAKSLAFVDVTKTKEDEVELSVIAVHVDELKATKKPRIVDKLTLFFKKQRPMFSTQIAKQVAHFLQLQAKPLCLLYDKDLINDMTNLYAELLFNRDASENYFVCELQAALTNARIIRSHGNNFYEMLKSSSAEVNNLAILSKISQYVLDFIDNLEVSPLPASELSTSATKERSCSPDTSEIQTHTGLDGTDETLVFVDLEAAGLPEENRLITELCMIAINRRDLVQRNISKVTENCDKLVLVIDPKHSITATAQALTHLTQATIMRSEKQPINKDVIQVIEDYLKRHRKPICFLAHGGNRFDFGVMRSQFRGLLDISSPFRGCKCADTLPAFRTLSWSRMRRERNSLDAIYERYFPSDVRQDTHQAESDVVSLMKVVRFQLSVLDLLNKTIFM